MSDPNIFEHIHIKADVIPISWRIKKAERKIVGAL